MSKDTKPTLNKASVLPQGVRDAELTDRVAQLEAEMKVILDWSQFAQKNTQQVFGWAVIGALFGQLAEKLQK